MGDRFEKVFLRAKDYYSEVGHCLVFPELDPAGRLHGYCPRFSGLMPDAIKQLMLYQQLTQSPSAFGCAAAESLFSYRVRVLTLAYTPL